MDLVTDRTEADVLLENEKGAYGYTDLNRVETAVQAVAREFPSLGVGLSIITKTDWGAPGDFSAASWPVESQMTRYLANVEAIRALFFISVKLPSSMADLTWQGANNIESVLQTAMERIEGIKQSYRYSGEVYAGEE